MSSVITYQGSKLKTGNLLELHYFDNDGPIWVYLPKEGLDHMCGRSLSDEEVRIVLLASEKELRPLINRVFDQFRGKYFRKLNITCYEPGLQIRKLGSLRSGSSIMARRRPHARSKKFPSRMSAVVHLQSN